MKRRLLAFVLALCLIMAQVPVINSVAAETTTSDEKQVSIDLKKGYYLPSCQSVDYSLDSIIKMSIVSDNAIVNYNNNTGTAFQSNSAASITIKAKKGYYITNIIYNFSSSSASPSKGSNNYNATTSTVGIVNDKECSTFTGCENEVVMNFGTIGYYIELVSVTVTYKEGLLASINFANVGEVSKCTSYNCDLDSNIKMSVDSDTNSISKNSSASSLYFTNNLNASVSIIAKKNYIITNVIYQFDSAGSYGVVKGYKASDSTKGMVRSYVTFTFTGSEKNVVLNFGNKMGGNAGLKTVKVIYKDEELSASIDLTKGYEIEDPGNIPSYLDDQFYDHKILEYEPDENITIQLDTTGNIGNDGDQEGTVFDSNYGATLSAIAKTGYVITSIQYDFHNENSPFNQACKYNPTASTAGIVNEPESSEFTGCETEVIMSFSDNGAQVCLTHVTVKYKVVPTYIDENGKVQTCKEYTELTGSKDIQTLDSGWYFVTGGTEENPIMFEKGIVINGDVKIILDDNCYLKTQGYIDNDTITCTAGIEVSTGNSLTIYSTSLGDNMGSIYARGRGNSSSGGAGIGASTRNGGTGCGTIIVNGGNIKANCEDEYASSCAGIGGARCDGGTIIINNGSILAEGSNYSAGIGGGGFNTGGNITINGGTVTAKGRSGGAGIGGGPYTNPGTVLITGGTITAVNGGDGALNIGHGKPFGHDADGGSVTITGGTYNYDVSDIVDAKKYDVTKSGSEQSFVWTVKDKPISAKVVEGDKTTNYIDIEEAISEAISSTKENAKTLVLLNDVSVNEIFLASGKYLTIDLNGHVINGKGGSSIFKVEGNLNLKDSNPNTEHKFDKTNKLWVLADDTAKGNNIATIKGGVITGGIGVINGTKHYGGAIYATENANVTINGISFVGNGGAPNTSGGAIYVDSNAKMSITNTVFMGNTGKYGGAIDTKGDVTIDGCTFKFNIASNEGGGILVIGKTILKNTVVTDNASNEDYWAGGVYVYNAAQITVSGKMIIKDNYSNGKKANLSLNVGTVIVDGLTRGSRIYVSTMNCDDKKEQRVFTTGTMTSNDLSYFESDYNGSKVVLEEGNLKIEDYKLSKVTSITKAITLENNDMPITATVTIIEELLPYKSLIKDKYVIYTKNGNDYKIITANSTKSWEYYDTLDLSTIISESSSKDIYVLGTVTEKQKYTITEADTTNGSFTVGTEKSILEGTEVTISNTPDDDYELDEYIVYKTGDSSDTINVTNGKFTMPEYAVTVKVTFKKLPDANISAPTTKTKVYDGNALTGTATSSTTGASITYMTKTTEDGTYGAETSNAPTLTAAGKLYVKAIVRADGYAKVSVEYVLTVNKANSSVSTTPSAKTLTYNGSSQALVNGGTASGGSIQYKLGADGQYSANIPEAKDANTYTVYYKVVGDGNHNDVTESSIQVTIAKADSSISTAPSAKTLTYNGGSQDLVNGGTASGGSIQYKLGADGQYSANIPEAKDANTYTVYYKVVGDSNHNDVTEDSIQVTIAKADSILTTAPTAKDLTYNGEDQALVWDRIPSGGTLQYKLGAEGQYSANVPKAKDAATYVVYYKVVGDSNHNDIEEDYVEVEIKKANSSFKTTPSAKSLTYNTSDQALVNEGIAIGGEVQYRLGTDGQYSSDIPEAKNAKTYVVYYKIVGDSNHNDLTEAFVEVTIDKSSDMTIEGFDYSNKYDGKAHGDEASCNIDTATITYSIDGGEFTEEVPTIKDFGTKEITVKAEDDNYVTVTADYTLNVEKRKLTLTSDNETKKYDGELLSNDTITVTEDGFVDGEGYEAFVTGNISKVGKVANAFTYELSEDTLEDNYDISVVFGTLTIYDNDVMTAAKAITEDNVTKEDANLVNSAIKQYELLIADKTLTSDEKKNYENQKERLEKAINTVNTAIAVENMVKALPQSKALIVEDESKVRGVEDSYNALSTNAKRIFDTNIKAAFDDCVAKIDELHRISYTPTIINGGKQEVDIKDKNAVAEFRSEALFDQFKKVTVDGAEVKKELYECKEGSIIVILSRDYLKTLKDGEHTISIVSTYGSADTTFTTMNVNYWLTMNIIVVAAIVLAGAAIIIVIKKKQTK